MRFLVLLETEHIPGGTIGEGREEVGEMSKTRRSLGVYHE